jgi:predicted RNase H-like nuclease
VPIICGADGCRTGWVTVAEDLSSGHISWHVRDSLEAIAQGPPEPQLIALDVPIGLPDIGSRECDLAARTLLGPRASSVFPAPIRCLLAAPSHADACLARERLEGKRLSIQAWAIVPKVREVDTTLRANGALRVRVREVHPEVCFYHMAGGRPMMHPKKKRAGREERRDLLASHFGRTIDAALADRTLRGCSADDLIDAFAALWTARRITSGQAVTIPVRPPRDSFGLPMEMVA